MKFDELTSIDASTLTENFATMEDIESSLLTELSQCNMDVHDILIETCVISDALDVVQTEGINVSVDVNAKIKLIEKIKSFIKNIFTKIIEFFQNISRAIYTYFHEKVVLERSLRLKKNINYLKDFYSAGISGDSGINSKIIVNTIKFENGQNFRSVINTMDSVEKNFDVIIDEIDDFVLELSKLKNTPNITNVIFLKNPDSFWNLKHAKFRDKRKKIFNALIPDSNPDLISDSEARKKIKERFFGEKLTRTEQDIKAVIPDFDIFVESIDEKLYSKFKAFVDNSTRKIKDANKRVDELVSHIDKAEDPTSSYSVVSGIVKHYAKLLNLLSTCISVHWELFLTIRGEIIRDGLIAIKFIKDNNFESGKNYELIN